MKRIITTKYAQVVEMADISARPIKLPNSIRKTLSDGVANVLRPNFFDRIPLQDIFDVFASQNVMAIQEDGTKWDGFLVGGAECGSDKTRDQVMNVPLAIKTEGVWKVTNTHLYLSWCKMPSGKMEVTGYIS